MDLHNLKWNDSWDKEDIPTIPEDYVPEPLKIDDHMPGLWRKALADPESTMVEAKRWVCLYAVRLTLYFKADYRPLPSESGDIDDWLWELNELERLPSTKLPELSHLFYQWLSHRSMLKALWPTQDEFDAQAHELILWRERKMERHQSKVKVHHEYMQLIGGAKREAIGACNMLQKLYRHENMETDPEGQKQDIVLQLGASGSTATTSAAEVAATRAIAQITGVEKPQSLSLEDMLDRMLSKGPRTIDAPKKSKDEDEQQTG